MKVLAPSMVVLAMMGCDRKDDAPPPPSAASSVVDAATSSANDKAELEMICDATARSGSTGKDVSERLANVMKWIDAQPKGASTKTLVDELSQLAPKDRGSKLRAEAERRGVVPCTLADAFDDAQASTAVALDAGSTTGARVVVGSSAEVHGPLGVDALERAVVAHQPALLACYLRGLKKDPKLAGRMVVHFTIDVSGKVTGAGLNKGGLQDLDVQRCALAVVQTLGFPAAASKVDVTLPLDFSP